MRTRSIKMREQGLMTFREPERSLHQGYFSSLITVIILEEN
jgi:hypothetical protein